MRNVYVIGAYVPNGGTFMAYHLGLIASEFIGGDPIAVRVGDENPESSIFEYPRRIPTVSIGEFRARCGPADVMIMNPSFSGLQLGAHVECFKLMYVQGYTTFSTLDSSFNSYVSVSAFVRNFLDDSFGIHTPIIPPFVNLTAAVRARPYMERPKDRVLVVTKGLGIQQADIFNQIKQKISANRPDVTFDFVVNKMKHKDFLALLAAYRYVLSLSSAEGFGLVPLESMGLGATVVAFDAGGGKAYMRDGKNCWCTSYPNVERLGDHLLFALNNPDLALAISRNSTLEARAFTYERFRQLWLNHLRKCPELMLDSALSNSNRSVRETLSKSAVGHSTYS